MIAGGFVVLSLALRIPFRSQFAFYWDGAQFALATQQYDLSLSLPHPPGYFLYVMLGRWLAMTGLDPHAALVWMSVVAGSLLNGMLYLLGAATFSRTVGVIAAVIGVTSALTWFYSLIAYTYVVDALYVVTFAWLCWRSRLRGVEWCDVMMLAFLYALILGTRQQSGMTLIPLLIYTLWGAKTAKVWKGVATLGLGAVAVGLWVVPFLAMAGGVENYLAIARAHVGARLARNAGMGLVETILRNLEMIGRFTSAGLLLGMPIMMAAYVAQRKVFAGILARQRSSACFWFYLAWLAPMILFWTVGFTDLPGHIMSYFAGLILLTAAASVVLARSRVVLAGTVGMVVLMNVWCFLTRPVLLRDLIAGHPLTRVDILENDRRLADVFGLVRREFAGHNVLICHANEFFVFGFRQFQYHLPDVSNLLLSPDPSLPGENAKKLWLGRQGRTELLSTAPLAAYRDLLLVVPPGWSVGLFAPYSSLTGVKAVPGSAGLLYRLPVTGD